MEVFHIVSEWDDASLPPLFTYPFAYTPDSFCVEAARRVRTYVNAHPEWHDELSRGKMLGVLVVVNKMGQRGFLAAFSGTLDGRLSHDWFVPPVLDYEIAGGVFKTEEENISEINRQIALLKNDEKLSLLKERLKDLQDENEKRLSDAKRNAKENKRLRQQLRLDRPELADELDRQSQFEKAELKRLTARLKAEEDHTRESINAFEISINSLSDERKRRSNVLQRWLFSRMRLSSADGISRSVWDIFRMAHRAAPPSATGDCCAPRLLDYAFRNGFTPVSMAEFWVGRSPKDTMRIDGKFYPACQAKCAPLMNYMLKGLPLMPNPLQTAESDDIEVVYEDEWLMVVSKPAGLPTTSQAIGADSLMRRAKLHCHIEGPGYVHRLDMATSGLLIIAKSSEVHKAIQRQFEDRSILKRYVALVEGIPAEKSGVIDLPLSADENDRPRQHVDFVHGLSATTRFEVVRSSDGISRIHFFPKTGRTHQLRVHAADKRGLGCPIVGDNLYGTLSNRLMLHSDMIVFIHPMTGDKLRLERGAEF
ncbi:MAG: RNA pseudouridine synthase [Bacteroidales bacterium]|nr:RNA pseudouridine synthase [Bacteroidales bacterium]